MYKLTERCNRLREEAVNVKSLSPRICAQWSFWERYGRACLDPHREYDNIVITAAGVASVMKNAPAIIGEDELIVGYNFGDGGYEWLTGNREEDEKRFRAGGFSEEQIAWYYDESVPVKERRRFPVEDILSEKERMLRDEWTILNSAGEQSLTANHTVLGYDMLLSVGFEGLLAKTEHYAAQNGDSSFYEALRMTCQAGMALGENYAREAERIGREDIAMVCRQVPRKGARSFREAVQSLWFAHIINTWEDTINANSIGRLDQILYPYYRHDLEAGLLTREEAFELICCLWVKLYRDYDVQQSCVGGRNPDGSTAVNELSYMMLDATECMGFVRCLSVRFDQNTDRKFLGRALEVVGHVQKGVPFFFNDDVMVPALTSAGISPEDACDYTQIGCVETVIPGKSNPHAVNTRCNLLKALEYALGNGYSLANPELRPGLETGEAADFTFEELLDAVREQIAFIVRSAVNAAVSYIPSSQSNDPKPVKSLLTEGCVEKGVDFNSQGAVYDYYQMMFLGIPNLADSLAAVKTLVFEEKRYTMDQLLYQLSHDWQDEVMRNVFLNKAPKYGNDDDAADRYAVEMTSFACDCLEKESLRTGYSFHAQPFTYVWMIDHGKKTGASPDGRHCGELMAYSLSPMQGRDHEGLTALLNSIAKLPTTRTPGTTSAIVEVDPLLFEDCYIPLLTDMLLAAGKKGLANVQFNTVNLDTLLDAKEHPERHRNLAVRVSGYSQKFNLLRCDLQDHIIARTKHAKL